MKFLFSVFTIFFSIFMSSCGDPNEYRVAPEFAKYVQQFENEANKRGKNYKLQTEGLIIEFANLKDDQAGLCHYENPIRIEVDADYWKKISTMAGAEVMKEDLIFHEMGHGILGRKHLNTILENGDWKSMMCGGSKVDNRPWNINYRRTRRDYYVDELFDESTPAPPFSYLELLTDTTGFTQKLALSFDTDSKSDTGWDLENTTNYSTVIENNQLKFSSKLSSSYAILLKVQHTDINILYPLSFEMEIDAQVKETTDQYGLVFAAYNTDSTEYFKINQLQKMFPGNSVWYSYYTQLQQNVIKKSGKNKLKVFLLNGTIHYFINNTYVYQTEMEIFSGGNNFGFIVPAGATVWVDNLKIGIKSSRNMTFNRLTKKDISFSIQEIKDTKNSFSNK